MPAATRQQRSIKVAFIVKTMTRSLTAKFEMGIGRLRNRPRKGQLPDNFLEMLPARGFMHSYASVTLESPEDIMADGKMPYFPANVRKYQK
jgi:hypothetical protein